MLPLDFDILVLVAKLVPSFVASPPIRLQIGYRLLRIVNLILCNYFISNMINSQFSS